MKNYFSKGEKAESFFILLLLSIIWGSSFILIKKGLETYSPAQVGTLRISFAFIFMLPVIIRNYNNIPRQKYIYLFFNGMIGNLIPAILFAYAETGLESSLTGILNALSPLFTLIFAVYIFKFKVNAVQITGLILGFVGSIGLSFVSTTGKLGQMNLYVWPVVAATICYAISINVVKAFLSDISSIIVTAFSLLMIGPVSLIYLMFTDFFSVTANKNGSGESLIFIAILGIFGTAIGLILYTRLIQMTNPVVASSVTYLIPIVAILWGLIDNEILYPLHYAGMLVILTGIYLVNRSEKNA